MGLLDYADAARKKLAGLLGDMPLVQMAQGRAEMPTMAGMLGALKSMPVFSPDAGQSAYEAALNIGPMGLGGIVWHGSPKAFSKFSLDAPKTTGGAFNKYGVSVSKEKKVADRYAKDFGGDSPNVYKVDESTTAPMRIGRTDFHTLQRLVGEFDRKAGDLPEVQSVSLESLLKKHGIAWDWQNKEHPISAIKKAGFDSIWDDGVMNRAGFSEQEALIFDPEKLKILERNGIPLSGLLGGQ